MFVMDRSKILKTFMMSGYQLTNDALNFLVQNPQKAEDILSSLDKKTAPTTIDIGFIEQFKKSGQEPNLTAKDYTNTFNRRFGVLKDILSQKTTLSNPISINKISPRTQHFSIIGMVKEKDEQNGSVLVEDQTGEISIVLRERGALDDIVNDEVIGVVCDNTENGVFGEPIFPDIPIKKEIKKSNEDVFCLFMSDYHPENTSFKKESYQKYLSWLENQEKMNIFIVGGISGEKSGVVKIISDIPKKHIVYAMGGCDDSKDADLLPTPSSFKIDSTNILLIHNKNIDYYLGLWGGLEKTLTNLLKKRHLDPTFNTENDPMIKDSYLLETIPDILVFGHTQTPSNTNYKGTTILTTGSFISQPIFWLINLRTREIFKKDFS